MSERARVNKLLKEIIAKVRERGNHNFQHFGKVSLPILSASETCKRGVLKSQDRLEIWFPGKTTKSWKVHTPEKLPMSGLYS